VVRHALVLGLASLSLVARDSGCGSVDSSSGGVNAPCTRNYDCTNGLSCLSGVCTGPSEDAGGPEDGSPPEAGGEAGKDAGADG
jgi:hypothetical protein